MDVSQTLLIAIGLGVLFIVIAAIIGLVFVGKVDEHDVPPELGEPDDGPGGSTGLGEPLDQADSRGIMKDKQ